VRDRAEILLAAKEQRLVHIPRYSPVFVTPAASKKSKQNREFNVSRCPLIKITRHDCTTRNPQDGPLVAHAGGVTEWKGKTA
jgi:hypothetical protein